MKVTIFIEQIHGGGAERVACNLANYLFNQGVDVKILTIDKDNPSYHVEQGVILDYLRKDSEKKRTVLLRRIASVLENFNLLKEYIKTNDCDCYVVLLTVPIIMFLLLRGFCRCPVIISERADPNRYSSLKQKLLKLLAKRADDLVFQTPDAAAWYAPYVRTKGHVIPNAVQEDFLNHQNTEKKDKTIISVGRLSAQKNFAMLIKAFSQVAVDFDDYRLLIMGEGPERANLLNLARELGIQHKVSMPGYSTDIKKELEKSYAFVLASDFEGMPNALMEAMAMELPCISTDCPCGGPRMLIEHEKNGLLIPVGNTEQLTQALRQIMENESFANALGRNARIRMESHRPDIIYGQWSDVITKVAK